MFLHHHAHAVSLNPCMLTKMSTNILAQAITPILTNITSFFIKKTPVVHNLKLSSDAIYKPSGYQLHTSDISSPSDIPSHVFRSEIE